MSMTPEQIAHWMSLGMRLQAAGEEKMAEVVEGLEEVVSAQEIIAERDWQLFMRPGRPTKRYDA